MDSEADSFVALKYMNDPQPPESTTISFIHVENNLLSFGAGIDIGEANAYSRECK